MGDNKGSVALIWRIENIDYILKNVGNAVWSPLFALDCLDYTNWYLKVISIEKRNGNYMSVYLRRCSCGPDSIHINCVLSSISDGSGYIDTIQMNPEQFENITFRKGDSIEIVKHLPYRSFIGTKLNNTTISVRCDMRKSNAQKSDGLSYFAHTVINGRGKPWHSEVVKLSTANTTCTDRQCEIKEEVVSDSLCQKMVEEHDVTKLDTVNWVNTDIMDLLKLPIIAKKSTCVQPHIIELSECINSVKPILNTNIKGKQLPTDSMKSQMHNHYEKPSTSQSDPKIPQVMDPMKSSLHTNNMLQSQEHSDPVKPSQMHIDNVKPLLVHPHPMKPSLVHTDAKKECDMQMAIEHAEDLNWLYAIDMYRSAVKKHLIPLQQSLSAFLRYNVSVSNACEILLHADMHQDDDLKIVVTDFISAHENAVINSKEWDSLEEINPRLAAKTLRQISLRRSQA